MDLIRTVRKIFRRKRRRIARELYHGDIPVRKMAEVIAELKKEKGRNPRKVEVADRLGCSRRAFYRMFELHPDLEKEYKKLVKGESNS